MSECEFCANEKTGVFYYNELERCLPLCSECLATALEQGEVEENEH